MNVISPEELSRGLLEKANPALSGVIAVYKEWGDTPLQTLDTLKKNYPVLENTPLSYAGRLDPLAEGLTLVLVGDANKDRESYLHLDKTYEVEVLFGVKTDTGDLFGVPVNLSNGNISDGDESSIKKFSKSFVGSADGSIPWSITEVIQSFIGKQRFPYPVYSSKTVSGKPLFQWMNEGKISEIEIPRTDVEIYDIKVIDSVDMNHTPAKVSIGVIYQKVEKALEKVKGDFRYDLIKENWKKVLVSQAKEEFTVLKIECSCSSGTYMRVLAEEIGKKIGMPALAYSIKRTKVGNVGLDAAVKLIN